MADKVLLTLFDGARPDAFEESGNEFYKKFKKESAYSLTARTVMPSETLPCHFSLFTSTDTRIHGVTSNFFKMPEKWIPTLFEQINASGKSSAVFYNWMELEDIWKNVPLVQSVYYPSYQMNMREANRLTTDDAIKCINEYAPDFVFLYIGEPDEVAHANGWMSEKYFDSINFSFSELERVYEIIPDDYTIILTADHGGHEYDHGSEMPEDMTIPLLIKGRSFEPGTVFENASIKDIAPTVADILGVGKCDLWQGKSLITGKGSAK